MAHTQRQTNLHATATTAIDELLLLLLQTNKKQKQSEAARNTCTHNQYEYIHTHQWHVVSNTNRIYPVSQSVSHISINPVLRTTIYQCIKQSIHQSIHFHRNVRRLYVSSNAKLRTNMPSHLNPPPLPPLHLPSMLTSLLAPPLADTTHSSC